MELDIFTAVGSPLHGLETVRQLYSQKYALQVYLRCVDQMQLDIFTAAVYPLHGLDAVRHFYHRYPCSIGKVQLDTSTAITVDIFIAVKHLYCSQIHHVHLLCNMLFTLSFLMATSPFHLSWYSSTKQITVITQLQKMYGYLKSLRPLSVRH